MKKLSLASIIGAMCLLASFIPYRPESNKAAATAEQREGVYIFMFSKPTAEYQFLGSIKKTGLVMSGKPEEMLNIMLKKCRKEYPQADAIVFSSAPEMDKADCIKFK